MYFVLLRWQILRYKQSFYIFRYFNWKTRQKYELIILLLQLIRLKNKCYHWDTLRCSCGWPWPSSNVSVSVVFKKGRNCTQSIANLYSLLAPICYRTPTVHDPISSHWIKSSPGLHFFHFEYFVSIRKYAILRKYYVFSNSIWCWLLAKFICFQPNCFQTLEVKPSNNKNNLLQNAQ